MKKAADNDMLEMLLQGGALSQPPRNITPRLGTARLTPDQAKALRRKASRKGVQESPPVADEEAAADGLEKHHLEFADAWGDKPQLENQYKDERYKGTWTESGLQMAVFNILKADELAKLNELLAEAEPPGAPQINISRLTEPKPSPVAESMHVVVCYRRIQYRQLLKKASS